METKKRTPKCRVVYSVYDRKTTLPLIIDGTAEACAKYMGISRGSFYTAVMRSRKKKFKRYEIYRHTINAKEGVLLG